jgi:nitrate/nitrite transport system permease protein
MTATVQPAIAPSATPAPTIDPPAPAIPPRRAGRLGPAASTLGWALLGAAVLVGAWALVCTRTDDLPTPAATFEALRTLLEGSFEQQAEYGRGIGLQLMSSLGRVFKGFAVATVVGVPVGLAMGASKRTWKAMNPTVQLLRPVSPLAWFPIALTITKAAPAASVWVIFVTALWLIVINTAAGAAHIPHEQLDVARVFRFSKPAYVKHVLVPNALPSVVTGLRSGMGIAWMVIVAVEMMSGADGIGFFVWDAYNAGNLDFVIGAIVIIGFVGLVLDALFLKLARKVTLEVRR